MRKRKASGWMSRLLALFVVLIVNLVFFNTSGQIAFAEEPASTLETQLNYSDGSHYEGQVLFGKIRTGHGSYSWSTGEQYEGTWNRDVPSGSGKMVWPGLGIYEGEYINGKRDGTGTFTWTYDGEPEDGQPVTYQGQWRDDEIGPNGTLTFANLGTYEGEFSKKARNGKGKFTWLNGDRYEGAWSNDQITGLGTFTAADGTVLEGQFSKNVLSKGTATYAVEGGTATRVIQGGRAQASVLISYNNGTTVSGKLKGDTFAGNVTINYPSGDYYVGTIQFGVKSGKGTYTWKDGAHYVGEWVSDKMSGKGTYYYGKDESRLSLSGTFSQGMPNGTLIYISENKLRYETIWSNGKCTSIKYKR